MTTLGEALAFARQRIDRLDARLLLQYATGCSHADLLARPEMPVIGPAGEQFVAWVERRAAGEPLAYLVGESEFRERVFQLSPAVLIPRPETEMLVEAALDLGARPMKTFFSVIVPLTKGGIIAGSMLVFIPAVGEFVIPELLGGPDSIMIGRVLWQEFFNNRDWPVASAVAIVMLLLLIVPIMWFHKHQQKQMGEQG